MTDQTISSRTHPSVQAFIDAASRAGLGASGVGRHAAYISAMANRLGVAPAELPPNAVALHFQGRRHSSHTAINYTDALTRFRHYLEHGITPPLAPGKGRPMSDPDVIRWERSMRATFAASTRLMYTQTVESVALSAGKPARELTKTDVTDYICERSEIAENRNRVLSNRRIITILTAVRNFCKDRELPDVTETIRRKRVDGEKTPPITREDLGKLTRSAAVMITSPMADQADQGRMWQLALKLMAFNGMRIGEVTGFNPSKGARHYFETASGWQLALHMAKGREGMSTRHIEAADAVIAELSDPYWHDRIHVFPPSWDASAASMNFKGFARLAGVDTRAHRLRAFYASEYYVSSDHDIVGLNKQMGHKELKTTMGYVHLGNDPKRTRAITEFGMEFLSAADRQKINTMRRERETIIPDYYPVTDTAHDHIL